MKKKITIGAALALLVLAAACGAAVRGAKRAESLEARLREVYDGAVLSALRQMEDMQLALGKALLSADSGAEARYLNQVSAGAAQVQRSLSLLPLSHAATRAAVKFANQVEDYTASLLEKDSLTEEDARRMNSLIDTCFSCGQALYSAREGLSARAAEQEDFYPEGQEETPSFDSAVSYPTLIYDGPFSDAREGSEAKALGPRAVTREEAWQLARDFVGADRVTEVSPGADMGGVIPCWGITLKTGDLTLQAAVTKQGGKMLWMAPDTADFPSLKSVEECRENALAFLSARGYENMRPTYFQVYQGVAVISFAATQGATVLYPDLVKVQLRMDTGAVVGIEARNYLMNHGARGLLTPEITEEEARQHVSPRLRVDAALLCLIPTDGGEKLCYEFQGEYAGRTYLAYINALTGRQEELLKVVEGETGLEAV